MIRYLAFLRGINVGGYRKIKMTDLRATFISAGYTDVITYIQSGNVIFNSTEINPELLSQNIEQSIEKTAGFRTEVIIRTASELENIVHQNPFEGREDDRHKLYVTFFKVEPTQDIIQELLSLRSDIEQFTIRKRELFSLIDKKAPQKSRFSNNFIEKHFNIPATTRNWRSVIKILELASFDS